MSIQPLQTKNTNHPLKKLEIPTDSYGQVKHRSRVEHSEYPTIQYQTICPIARISDDEATMDTTILN